MKLTILGSSSSGNGYIIQDEEEALILEAGFSLNKVKQALGFNISKVSGVLITHSHGDHAKYAKDYEMCFPLYANASVIEEKKLSRAVEVKSERGFMAGNFKVIPFEAFHDVPCHGYLIYHKKLGNLMFLTDSSRCDYTFSGLNNILIECNYVTECIDENVSSGKVHPCVQRHVKAGHMELNTCKNILLSQDLSNVHNILLLHLSSQNSDPELMYEVIAKETGKPITIAKPGIEIELNKNPY